MVPRFDSRRPRPLSLSRAAGLGVRPPRATPGTRRDRDPPLLSGTARSSHRPRQVSSTRLGRRSNRRTQRTPRRSSTAYRRGCRSRCPRTVYLRKSGRRVRGRRTCRPVWAAAVDRERATAAASSGPARADTSAAAAGAAGNKTGTTGTSNKGSTPRARLRVWKKSVSLEWAMCGVWVYCTGKQCTCDVCSALDQEQSDCTPYRAVNSHRGAVNSVWIWETPNTYPISCTPRRTTACKSPTRGKTNRGTGRTACSPVLLGLGGRDWTRRTRHTRGRIVIGRKLPRNPRRRTGPRRANFRFFPKQKSRQTQSPTPVPPRTGFSPSTARRDTRVGPRIRLAGRRGTPLFGKMNRHETFSCSRRTARRTRGRRTRFLALRRRRPRSRRRTRCLCRTARRTAPGKRRRHPTVMHRTTVRTDLHERTRFCARRTRTGPRRTRTFASPPRTERPLGTRHVPHDPVPSRSRWEPPPASRHPRGGTQGLPCWKCRQQRQRRARGGARACARAGATPRGRRRKQARLRRRLENKAVPPRRLARGPGRGGARRGETTEGSSRKAVG